MRDVAERAGVSISTVSHVLNNTRPVAEVTRVRVLQIMRQLNYYKNASGRRLARGRSDAFGLIISDVENPFFPEMIKTFERAVVEIGFDVFLAPTNYDPIHASNAVRRMIENKVQGVAVMTSQLEADLIDQLLQNDIPVVTLDGSKFSRGRSNIRVDYSSGVREAVEYLKQIGHRRTAFITGPQHRLSAKAYKQAFIDALEQNQMPATHCTEGDNTIEGGRAAMAALLKEPEVATAVICGNDLMALGAVHALVEAGIEVPGQISIIGAEDIPYARYANPPLTTVRIARDQLGRLAFEALHRLMRSKRRQGSEYVVETRLIVRGSSAPVSTRN
ncbi:MAG: LacI family DNA-binding transcriptional regulator [Acidobacteria bacterium]|nr:LacI family DNA-binding transcriptional regulator [Acidobacteriota bacterium]